MHIGKKYRLPPADEKRWRRLACLEAVGRLTQAQDVELERLTKKRRRLLNRHPRMVEANKARQNSNRRIRRKIAGINKRLKKLGLAPLLGT